jgi:hypothetical protein
MEFLLKAHKIKSLLSVQCTCANGFKNFSLFLFKNKIKIKFLFASLKHFLIIDIVQKAGLNFCSGFPLLSLVDFLQCTFIAGYKNSFQNQRRFLEQLLESQGRLSESRN